MSSHSRYLFGHLVRLVPVEALDALVRLVVELDVVGLALRVHHLEGVRPVAVEVAVAHGGPTVGEEEADLLSIYNAHDKFYFKLFCKIWLELHDSLFNAELYVESVHKIMHLAW